MIDLDRLIYPCMLLKPRFCIKIARPLLLPQLFLIMLSLLAASSSRCEPSAGIKDRGSRSFISSTNSTPEFVKALVKNGAVVVESSDRTELLSYRGDTPLIPASTIKLATAYCGLTELGSDYRFETVFFSGPSSTLYIKGSGDPSLVSETLDGIARDLARSLQRVERIVIDNSFFADDIDIDGSASSLNPYDAKNSAFVANYSSAALMRSRSGEVISAEQQTPLTPISKQAGQRLSKGLTERISLSTDWRVGARYGGELLGALLTRHGVSGQMLVSLGNVPPNATAILRHHSPLSLEEIARGMLKYSTNFTANQIFLVLGAKKFGAPATVSKAQQAFTQCLATHVGWTDFHVEEGSGLSRKTRVTAQQMTQLLRVFDRYSHLLPERDGFLAKTGTLRGVNTLAGYFDLGRTLGQARFCILVNSDVAPAYKFKVAAELRHYLKNIHN